MKTKTCTNEKCGETKLISEFYKHKSGKDGYTSNCKECIKAYNRQYRQDNLEEVRLRDTERNKKPARQALHRVYAQTFKNKFPKVTKASNAVNNALRDKKISKPTSCTKCNDSVARIEGHHTDYDFPLDVTWVCSPCHKSLPAGINKV